MLGEVIEKARFWYTFLMTVQLTLRRCDSFAMFGCMENKKPETCKQIEGGTAQVLYCQFSWTVEANRGMSDFKSKRAEGGGGTSYWLVKLPQ